MDSTAIDLVVSSWEDVKKKDDYAKRFGTFMFNRVNQLSPELEATFSSLNSGGGPPRHMMLFVGMVDMMVQLLGPDMTTFAKHIMDLGERHSKHGIRSLDFPIFWKALSSALTEMLGRDVFRGQVEAAWLRLWHCVSLAMIQGSRRVTDRSRASPAMASLLQSPTPPTNGRSVGRAKSFVSKLNVFKHDGGEVKSPTRNSYGAFLRASNKESSPTSSTSDSSAKSLKAAPLSSGNLTSLGSSGNLAGRPSRASLASSGHLVSLGSKKGSSGHLASLGSSGHLSGRSRMTSDSSHYSTSYLSRQSSPALLATNGLGTSSSGSKNASWDPIDLALSAAKARNQLKSNEASRKKGMQSAHNLSKLSLHFPSPMERSPRSLSHGSRHP